MIKRTALFYIIYFILFNHTLKSQTLSDLKQKLPTLNPQEKIDCYLKIANFFGDKLGQTDSLLFYSQLAYKKSKEINCEKCELASLLNIAVSYQKQNNFDTSITILNKLLPRALKTNNQELIGDIKFNLGVDYRRLNNFKEATENFIEALSVYEKTENNQGITLTHVRLAGIFTLQKQFPQALIYGTKAKQSMPQNMEPLSKITVLSTLSGMYIQIAANDKRYIDSAILCAKTALDLTNKYGYFTKGNQLCLSISNAFTNKGEDIKALEYCKRSLEYRKYLFPKEILVTYLTLSNCYYKLKQNTQAITYIDSVKYILKDYPDPFYEMRSAESAHEYYKAVGNVNKSLECMERFHTLKDSLFNEEKTKVINELEQKYNKAQNEKTIKELGQEKEILNQKEQINNLRINALIFGVLFLALLIFVIVFFYRQSLLKNKFKTLEIEQRLNRARINPHFFFNALASLQSLSLEEKKSKEISEYIHRFSKIMRESLESTFNELNTIENEIEFLTHYLELQKLRSDNKFTYSFNISKDIETDAILIPGMVLQPFIENSIEHGFSTIESGGLIEIHFYLKTEKLYISITDNGSGFKENEKHKNYPSRATQIIRDRLYLLNKKYKTNATFELTNNLNNAGTKVEIMLPVITKGEGINN